MELERHDPGACQAAEPGETYYTPGKVAHYLSTWPELLEKATPTARSSSRFSFDPDGSTDIDPFSAVLIVADIERAWATLHRWSLEFQMVEWSTRRPLGIEHKDYLVAVADALRVSVSVANGAFFGACWRIAGQLGWRE